MMDELLLLERLSDGDLAVLAQAGGERGEATRLAARLRFHPERIDHLLGRPDVFDALFGDPRDDPLVVVAPFLAFSVLLAHTASVLEDVSYVPEWVGARQRVPVFEVEPLRQFLASPLQRVFLADLLSSYTHVASGALWVKARRGWRHRRFSELDPAQFAELILSVPHSERLALYRRLGDLSLFLTGVFPDYVERRALTPIAVERLRRAVAGDGSGGGRGRESRAPTGLPRVGWMGAGSVNEVLSAARGEGTDDVDDGDEWSVEGWDRQASRGVPPNVGLLEWLGRRSYRLAWQGVEFRQLGLAPALGEVVRHFRHARMILNYVTGGHLFEHRQRWFPLRS
jgi:hypothetical protein